METLPLLRVNVAGDAGVVGALAVADENDSHGLVSLPLHTPDIRLSVLALRATGQGRAAPRQRAEGALMRSSAKTILSQTGMVLS